MMERSREMVSSPPTAEEIFRDYCAPRIDTVHSLTNGWFFYFYRGVAGVRVRFIRKKNHFCGYIETFRKKALKLLLLQPISTIYQALVEAPGKHIHYIANLEKPW